MEKFIENWLKAWTGNKPEKLIEFYDKGAFYLDPAKPGGLTAHSEILPYFKKLLAQNPNWTWKAKEIIPTEKGFVLKWAATIPAKEKTIKVEGLDIVEVSNDKITRNEVYFDRSVLM